MRKILYVAVFVLALLACGVPSMPTVPAPTQDMPAPQVAPTPPVLVQMVVTADRLNIRAAADYNSAADAHGLRQGQIVKVYQSCTGGEIRAWVAIDRDCTRWVKASWLAVVK